jgi:hypothetical protein
MTALAADRILRRSGSSAVSMKLKSLPVAAATTIYGGSIVALNQSGYVVPASADPTLFVVGVAVSAANNAAGAAGAISCVIERGVFSFNNSSSTSALTDADVGRTCYAADDSTVARITAIGTLPPVGKVMGLDGSDVLVEVGLLSQSENAHDLLIVTGVDLSSVGQYRFVSLNSSGAVVLASTAGMVAIGVLLNAPASGAVAIVRRRGLVRMLAEEAITENVSIAVSTSGRAKIAAATTCDASGASATAALTGSFIMGTALEEASGAADMFLVDVHPSGIRPGTLA